MLSGTLRFPQLFCSINSYRVDAVQLTGHTELRDIITQQHGVHMHHWNVLHQAVVHILNLLTHKQKHKEYIKPCITVSARLFYAHDKLYINPICFN